MNPSRKFVRITLVLEGGTVVVGDVGDDAVVAALPPNRAGAASVVFTGAGAWP